MIKAHIFQRRTLGILGITLPFMVLLIGRFGNNAPGWYYSISASAYTNAAPWFLATMGAVGWFLIAYAFYAYKEYGKLDFAINFASGVCALVVAFFPCFTSIKITSVGLIPLSVKVSSVIHNVSAAAFFGLLTSNILFLFTKSAGAPTAEKLKRNLVYRICGSGMLAFIISQIVTAKIGVDGPATMINETGMLICFGVAWLVKGEATLKDKSAAGS